MVLDHLEWPREGHPQCSDLAYYYAIILAIGSLQRVLVRIWDLTCRVLALCQTVCATSYGKVAIELTMGVPEEANIQIFSLPLVKARISTDHSVEVQHTSIHLLTRLPQSLRY